MPIDPLSLLGIATVSSWVKDTLSDVIKDAFKDYAKDFFKDEIKSHVHLEGTPLHAAVAKAVTAFLAALEEQLRKSRDFSFEATSLSSAAGRFVKEAAVRDLLAGQFEDLSQATLEPSRLMAVWRELHLPPALDESGWEALRQPYFKAVTKIVRDDKELRALLSADRESAALRAAELQAGPDPEFRLEGYRNAILGNFEFVKLAALSVQGRFSKMRLMDLFVSQRARRLLRHKEEPSVQGGGGLPQPRRWLSAYPHSAPGPIESGGTVRMQEPARNVIQILRDAELPRVVILGRAGSGKSSLAKYLCLRWVKTQSGPLPFFIELPRYLADRNSPTGFLDYLESGGSAIWHFAQRDVAEHLRYRDCVLILDALDEVQRDHQRRDLVQEIVRFAVEYPRTRIVLTSRTNSYLPEDLEQAGFAHFELQDFDTDEIEQFLERWHDSVAIDAAEKKRSMTRLKELPAGSDAIQMLAANPLLLTMLALLNQAQRPPGSRPEIYERVSQLLLEDWERQKTSAAADPATEGIGPEEKRMILRLVARRMLQTPSELAANAVTQKDLESVIAGFLKSIEFDRPLHTSRLLVTQLGGRDTVLASAGSAGYSFIHRSFLEYFGALDLKVRVEDENSESIAEIKQTFRQHFDNEFWREVLRLLAVMLDWRHAYDVLADLATVQDPEAVLLAALCFSEHPSRSRMPQLSRSLLDRVKELTEYDLGYYRHDFAESTYSRFPIFTRAPALFIRQTAITLLAETWSTEAIDHLKSLVSSVDASTARHAIEELSNRWPDRNTAFQYLVSLTEMGWNDAVRSFAWQEITEKWKHVDSVGALVHGAARADLAPEISTVLLNFLLKEEPRLPETRNFLRFCARFADSIELAQLAWNGLAKYWNEDGDSWALIFSIAESKREWLRAEAIHFLARQYADQTRVLALLKRLAKTELASATSVNTHFAEAVFQELERHSAADGTTKELLDGLPEWLQDMRRPMEPDSEPIPSNRDELRRMIEAPAMPWPETARQMKALERYAYSFGGDADVIPVVLSFAERQEDAHDKAAACRLLAELWIEDREVLYYLLRTAESDAQSDVRASCCQILMAFAPRDRQLLEFMERRIAEDPEEDVREQCVVGLTLAWKATDEVRRALLTIGEQNDSGKARAKALHALARLWPRDREIGTLLKMRLAADDNADVRAAAIEELGWRWRADSDVAGLLASRAESDPNHYVRMRALEELNGMGQKGPDLLRPAIELLRPGGAPLRQIAVQSLAAWFKDAPEMFSAISRLARLDPEPEVRRFAAFSVATLWTSHPGAVELLESVVSYGYPWPREMDGRRGGFGIPGQSEDDAFRDRSDEMYSPVDVIRPGSPANAEAARRLLQNLATYDLRWQTRQRAIQQLARAWSGNAQVDAFLDACSRSDEKGAVRWTARRELVRRRAVAAAFEFGVWSDHKPVQLSPAALARKQYSDASVPMAADRYGDILKVYTETEAGPVWAYFQIVLGDLLMSSALDELRLHAAEIRRYYEGALRVYSESHTPWHWAQTCLRLAQLHDALITEGGQAGAQHAQKAIQYLESCLRVWTQEWNPVDWAATQDYLGNLYRDSGGPDRGRAFDHYQEALKVYTRESFPRDYALVQENLGNAWKTQARGSPHDLTRAIHHYEEASAHTGDSLKRAALQDWIGECTRRIETGDRAGNIRRAIQQSESALTVFTEKFHAPDWASANELLGLAHMAARVISGDEEVRAAIRCFEAALRVNTRTNSPFRWAALQDSLAESYQFLESGDRLQNLSLAATLSQSALEEFPRASYPMDWAMVQINLGDTDLALFALGVVDAAHASRAHYELALEVCAGDALIAAAAKRQLGAAYRALGDLTEARELQMAAMAAVDKSTHPQTHAEMSFELALTFKHLVLRGETCYQAPYRENLEGALKFYDAAQFPTRHRQILSATS